MSRSFTELHWANITSVSGDETQDIIAIMAVPRARILDLMKVDCSVIVRDLILTAQAQSRIFSTIFNPTGARLGNKILRQRLKGPSLSTYYPRRVATFRNLQDLYPGFEMYDEVEEERLEHITIGKSRGKGAPKKKKTAAGRSRMRHQ